MKPQNLSISRMNFVEWQKWTIRALCFRTQGAFFVCNGGGESMELKNRADRFIADSGVAVTAFARKVELSAQSIHRWRKNELNLSQAASQRIDEYLKKFNY